MEKEDIIQAVKDTIQEVVNGKIDRLHIEVQDYKQESKEWRGTVDTKLDELKPFLASLTFIGTVKAIIKETVSWLVPLATITAIVGAVYHYFKN